MTFLTYDELAGPALDPALWEPLSMGVPRLEEGAITTVSDGVVTVDVPEFTNADPANQSLDNTKHVLLSTRRFDLPADGPARFRTEIAVDHIGGDSGDYRLGAAAFILVDTDGATAMVFDVLATADRVYAEHEVLPFPGVPHPFTRIVDNPIHPVAATGFRLCEVRIDRSSGRATWTVDGFTVLDLTGLAELPESVHIGFGYVTLLPIGEGRSSAQGQGARASWRNFRYDVSN
ncbi:DUF6081 family protein [Actinoplanes sp. NBRC 103695]|uniref:DUF6081 family protein n=1 Tax=Actinoplanes sp. NBRC 103695 TaxID=3032202 RepID=UPI0024A2EB97|nr:DUF6081 family protein [Actinoplanes sp. NBRC 103695]GLY94217.1 hypothetical protein Acsp02_14730 [Actinoplanes sp. NBRC 103695]